MTSDWKKQDPHYSDEKKRYPNPVPSRQYILTTLKNLGKSVSIAALAKQFALNRAEKETFTTRIRAMLRDGQLEERANNKVRLAKPAKVFEGEIFAHAEGYGFFMPKDGGEDFYLSPYEMQTVMHGDKATAQLIKGQHKGKKEARIVDVLARHSTHIIGRLVDGNGKWLLRPENRRINQRVELEPADKSLQLGVDKIVKIEITHYPDAYQSIIVGKIVEVLGDYMDAGLEIDVAIENFGLPNRWSPELQQELAQIPDEVLASDYPERVDLRHLPLVTIDGIDSRDFDDAVYVRQTNTGFKLYVAIADVAHYVGAGGALDKEAYNRGTSVYFPNRVIPMLPEKLSNGLCSLNPQVDRLCMVAEMQIDKVGNLRSSRFYNAVMHSHARLTYETVEELLFLDNTAVQAEYKTLLKDLQALKALYLVLREQRNERGAINFHSVEPEFEYNSAGKIEHIRIKAKLKSHQLIEEFMVRANVCAAKFIEKNKGVALFRNHVGPSDERLEGLVQLLAKYGIRLPEEVLTSSKGLAEVVDKLQSRDDFAQIQMGILRSMYQALYQPLNAGHFGLALEHYAHFTSPIRRYPDLLVHRAIKHILQKDGSPYLYTPAKMEEMGKHTSMCERRADSAANDVVMFLKCEYMLDKVGAELNGSVSSVTNFGLFITLRDEFIDGLVHISNLGDDYYFFDEQNLELRAERSGKVYRMGDEVVVRVDKVDVDQRRIDFSILSHNDAPVSQQRRKSKSSKSNKSKSAKYGNNKGDKKGKNKAAKSAKTTKSTKSKKKR